MVPKGMVIDTARSPPHNNSRNALGRTMRLPIGTTPERKFLWICERFTVWDRPATKAFFVRLEKKNVTAHQ
jgi:hypothetical protein